MFFTLISNSVKFVSFILQLMRGKNHGALDVSLAVMSVNKKSRRIDLDAGDNLLHLKVCSPVRPRLTEQRLEECVCVCARTERGGARADSVCVTLFRDNKVSIY